MLGKMVLHHFYQDMQKKHVMTATSLWLQAGANTAIGWLHFLHVTKHFAVLPFHHGQFCVWLDQAVKTVNAL